MSLAAAIILQTWSFAPHGLLWACGASTAPSDTKYWYSYKTAVVSLFTRRCVSRGYRDGFGYPTLPGTVVLYKPKLTLLLKNDGTKYGVRGTLNSLLVYSA